MAGSDRSRITHIFADTCLPLASTGKERRVYIDYLDCVMGSIAKDLFSSFIFVELLTGTITIPGDERIEIGKLVTQKFAR